MSGFFSDISMALQIWEKDGALIKKGIAIFDKLEAIDNGELGEKIDAVLKSEGIDIGAILANAASVAASPSSSPPAKPVANPEQPVVEHHPASQSIYIP
jgi:hypothetical protein